MPLLNDEGRIRLRKAAGSCQESNDPQSRKQAYLFETRSSKEGRTEDALPLLNDEGRIRLRKAAGSCQESNDPRISEWGNPAGVISSHPYR